MKCFSKNKTRVKNSSKIETVTYENGRGKNAYVSIVCALLLVFVLFFSHCGISNKTEVSPYVTIADKDKSIIALGQLWGFLKYHHPYVAEGKYDWDAEFVRMFDAIMQKDNDLDWKTLLNDWFNELPLIESNNDKIFPDLDVKVSPHYGVLFDTIFFHSKTIEKVQFLLDNAIIQANHYAVIDMNRHGQLFIVNEELYEDMLFPDLSYRVLALFRFWNIVNYFFPYRELADDNWMDVLIEMLHVFENATDRGEYLLACQRLIAKINDSHAWLYFENKDDYNFVFGGMGAPLELQFIENELIITMITTTDSLINSNIRVGDIIYSIEGEPVIDVVERLQPYTTASNNAVMNRAIASNILRGNTDSIVLSMKRDEIAYNITIPRYDIFELNFHNYANPYPERDGYSILEGNIGYILSSSCKPEDREVGINKLLSTKGIIVDMRCYPEDYIMTALLEITTTKDEIPYPMKMNLGNISFPGYFFIHQYDAMRFDIPKMPYGQKIIVLVNEYTQSHAEEQIIFLQSIPNITLLGSTTAGAFGRMVWIDMPGGIYVCMTGTAGTYADGTHVQRNGIKIDEYMRPTIAGVRAGRDELLERAIEIIEKSYMNR
jgi:C-terminal processing protease CtpA/Prc